MPSSLDDKLIHNYFALLGAHINQMPEAAHEEHLRELHQHFEALVAASVASGVTEKAIPAALAQMGDPAQIGSKLWHEWKLTTQRKFWRTVLSIGIGQLIMIGVWHVMQMFYTLQWFPIASNGHQHYLIGLTGPTIERWQHFVNVPPLLINIIGGIVVGKRLPERAIVAAFYVGLVGSIGSLYCEWYISRYSQSWMPLGLGVSGYEVLAAYVVSSLKRKDWNVQVQ